MVWVSVNRIRVDSAAEAEKVLDAFRHRAGKVDLQPGFLAFEVWKEETGSEIMVVTRWKDRESFVTWVEGPAFRHAHARAGDAPGTAHGSSYEVVL
jgi:heme-degrading monooxygenase HmoA